jgi:hypothetical protein
MSRNDKYPNADRSARVVDPIDPPVVEKGSRDTLRACLAEGQEALFKALTQLQLLRLVNVNDPDYRRAESELIMAINMTELVKLGVRKRKRSTENKGKVTPPAPPPPAPPWEPSW